MLVVLFVILLVVIIVVIVIVFVVHLRCCRPKAFSCMWSVHCEYMQKKPLGKGSGGVPGSPRRVPGGSPEGPGRSPGPREGRQRLIWRGLGGSRGGP